MHASIESDVIILGDIWWVWLWLYVTVEARKPVHPFNHINTQTKVATLIIITLNTLTMKHKSEILKITDLKLFNEEFVI